METVLLLERSDPGKTICISNERALITGSLGKTRSKIHNG
jgi:hypothetical protein